MCFPVGREIFSVFKAKRFAVAFASNSKSSIRQQVTLSASFPGTTMLLVDEEI